MSITRSDIEMYFGELSDDLVARMLAMRLTSSDLAEIALQMEDSVGEDDALDEQRIAELCLLVGEDAGRADL